MDNLILEHETALYTPQITCFGLNSMVFGDDNYFSALKANVHFIQIILSKK